MKLSVIALQQALMRLPRTSEVKESEIKIPVVVPICQVPEVVEGSVSVALKTPVLVFAKDGAGYNWDLIRVE